MIGPGLDPDVIEQMLAVFRQVPGLREVVLYGSRAKGTHRIGSDIDLALVGVDDILEAQAVAEALDELPLPYRFDVQSLVKIAHPPLRAHIARAGRTIYRCGDTNES